MAASKTTKANEPVKAAEVIKLEKELSKKKRAVSSVKKDIESANAQLEDITEKHAKRVKDLKDRDSKIKNSISTRRKTVDSNLISLAKKQEEFAAEEEASNKYINDKIEELKNKRKALLETENELDNKSFLKKKAAIEKQLASLRSARAKQAEDYDRKMSDLKASYDALLSEKKNDIVTTKAKLEAERVAAEEEQARLNAIKAEELRKQEEEKERLRIKEEERLAKLEKEKNEAISALTASLSGVTAEYNSLVSLKDNLTSELANTKLSNDSEYNNLVAQLESENSRMLSEYNLKCAELADTQATLDTKIKTYRQNFEAKTKELEEYAVLLEERKTSRKQSVIKAVEEIDASLKAKNAGYLDYLDQQIETARKNRSNELEALKYNLEQEEIQLKNRNEYCEVRLQKKEDEFKTNLEESARQLNELNEKYILAENANASRKNELSNLIEQLKNDHYFAIEGKANDYKKAYEDRQNELTDKENSLNAQLSEVKDNISAASALIDSLRRQLEDVNTAFERNRNEITVKHENRVNDLTGQIEYLKKQISELQTKASEEDARYKAEFDKLTEKENSKREAHEKEMAIIEEDFASRKAALELRNAEDNAAADKDYKQQIADIENKYQENVAYAQKAFADKKDEYDTAKVSIEEHLNKIATKAKEKFEDILEHRNQILSSIDVLKADSLAEEEKYKATVADMDRLYADQLEELKTQHNQKLETLNAEYEAKNLESILSFKKNELSEKQIESAKLAGAVEAGMKQMDIDLAKLEDDLAKISKAKQNELTEKENAYETLKKDNARFEEETENELARRKSLVESYLREIDETAKAFKQQREDDYNAYAELLNEQFKQKEAEYESSRIQIGANYDAQIEAISKQLELKSENYNALLEDIALRKESAEEEYRNKFAQELDYTNLIQQRLDLQVSQNNERRSELNAVVEAKRAQIADRLAQVENEYNEALNSKKEAFKEYEASMNGKCEALKIEIDELQRDVDTKRAEFEAYAAERKQELIEIKDRTKAYVDEITTKINNIEGKAEETRKLHNERVVAIKKQIAEAMSEYDDLLRNSSNILSEKTADAKDLEEAAVAFKDRIDTLENTYASIVSQLENEKMGILKGIEEQIDDLDKKSDEERNRAVEDLNSIEQMYASMIASEKEKQDSLNSQFELIKQEHELEMEQISNTNMGMPGEYENKVSELVGKFNEEMKAYSLQFKQSSENMKTEFDKLLNTRGALNQKAKDIVSAYSILDAEIEKGKSNLQMLTRKMMKEILARAARRVNEAKDLSAFDTMKKH